MSDKAREQRLRREAERQGLRLEKSRVRIPEAFEYGTYHLVDGLTGVIVAYGLNSGFGLSLDDIEAYMADKDEEE